MKVKIDSYVPASNIQVGSCFLYEDRVWIRIENNSIFLNEDKCFPVPVVSLNEGYVNFLADCVQVMPLPNATVTTA